MKQLTRKLQSELSNWHSQDYTVKKTWPGSTAITEQRFHLMGLYGFQISKIRQSDEASIQNGFECKGV